MIIIIMDGLSPIIVDVFATTTIGLIVIIMIRMIVMITHIGIITATITITANTLEVGHMSHFFKRRLSWMISKED